MKNKNINRRDFLRCSVVGAGSFLLPVTATSALNKKTRAETVQIPVRTLGRTGIQIPILSMGVDRPDSNNVLKAAYNSGVFHFDTAHFYQNGRNEEMIGRMLEGKPRDSFCVSTKLTFDYPLKDNFEENMMERLDISLKRLKMDYVDIFYLHTIHMKEKLQDERVINFLKKIKELGKTRFVGFSSHDQKPELLHVAVDLGIYDVALISYNFKMKNIQETDEAIDRAVKSGMGIIAMKTLTGGTEDAEGNKKINAQACLKWVWKNKNITTAIPGFFNFDQLEELLAAAHDPLLTNEDQEYLANLQKQEGLYCQQCGSCKSQCTKNLPIPDVMRAYMYTYGYKHPQLSKDTLLPLGLAQNICSDCNVCSVNCPSGFNVSKKMMAILPVTEVSNEFLA